MKRFNEMCSRARRLFQGDTAEGKEESNLPSSHKMVKTESEQSNELRVVDSNVDGPEYTQKATTSNPNELEAPGGIHDIQVHTHGTHTHTHTFIYL